MLGFFSLQFNFFTMSSPSFLTDPRAAVFCNAVGALAVIMSEEGFDWRSWSSLFCYPKDFGAAV
jgi:hypothetical protein